MEMPRFEIPPGLIAGVLRDWLLGRVRSLGRDARACVGRWDPPLQVLGREYVPQHGPCVLTVNHYHRAGFASQWIALAITASLSTDIHWIMTGEWTFPGKWYAPLGRPASRLVLGRLARLYGFTTMPPMPPRPRDLEARAAAVRRVLKLARGTADLILGLAPEGADAADGKLARPAPGLGRFGLLLAALGLPYVPVGAYESEGAFCLRFGEPYRLAVAPGLAADERDRRAAQTIMIRIAALLPQNLRGGYA